MKQTKNTGLRSGKLSPTTRKDPREKYAGRNRPWQRHSSPETEIFAGLKQKADVRKK